MKNYEMRIYKCYVPKRKMRLCPADELFGQYCGGNYDPADVTPCESKDEAVKLAARYGSGIRSYDIYYVLEWAQATEVITDDEDNVVEESCWSPIPSVQWDRESEEYTLA